MPAAKRRSTDVPGGAARALVGAARATAVLLALVMLVGGCTSFYPVDIHTADGLAAVEPGATVRVTTTAGERREFEVREVTPQTISGPEARYTAVQIATLERREDNTLKMLALGGVVYVVWAAVGTTAFLLGVFG